MDVVAIIGPGIHASLTEIAIQRVCENNALLVEVKKSLPYKAMPIEFFEVSHERPLLTGRERRRQRRANERRNKKYH